MNVTTGAQAVSVARQWLGTPYCWGGGHGGQAAVGSICVDCSGLVNQVFGITGTTFTQVAMGAPVANISNAQPGDLVFFGPIAPGEPHHVGIYVGNNIMIDAPTTGIPVGLHNISGYGPINAIRRLTAPGNGQGGSSDTTATSNVTYTYAQLEGVWIQAGGNPQYADMAAAIAMAESGGRSMANGADSNGSVDRGLWQINSSNGSSSSFDVMTNARAAVQISNNGTNWRPWCSAYSDNACGTQGGTYLGQGAHYQKFLNSSVQPDMTAPINGTNAAAGTQDTGTATDQSFEIPNPICIALGSMCPTAVGANIAKTLLAIMATILNPLIQMVAGVLGIAAGGLLMIFGLYMVFQKTEAGQATDRLAGSAARTGLRVAAPELGVGMTGAERAVQGRRQLSRENLAGRSALSSQGAQQRITELNTKEQIRREAWQYHRANQPQEA